MKLISLLVAGALALIPALALTAGEGSAMPLGASRPAGAVAPVINVKLKCALNEDGVFRCTNVKKKKKTQSEAGGSGSGNKCKGKNDCGDGYRDLDTPNQYGACCEEIKDQQQTPQKDDPPDEPDEPKTGKCQQVQNSAEMNCKAPFDGLSCGALENGVMTCCCVK